MKKSQVLRPGRRAIISVSGNTPVDMTGKKEAWKRKGLGVFLWRGSETETFAFCWPR